MSAQPFQINIPQATLDDLQARLKLTRWTEMPRGGHFAALEAPELYAEDIRVFFRPFRG